MTKIEKATLEIRLLLKPIIGEVKVKTYFSYYALFKNNAMFSLFKNGDFYLKITEKFKEEMLNTDGVKALKDDEIGINVSNFYLIPKDLMNNLEKYSHWIKYAIKETKNANIESKLEKRKLIRNLPNMNINIERTLHRLNITSTDDLISAGEIDTFVKLIKKGIDANSTLLFKLYGAINYKYECILTLKEKEKLIEKVNIALYNEGLRNTFSI